MNIMLYIGTFFFYREINKRRDRRWDAMDEKVWHLYSIVFICVHNARLATPRIPRNHEG